MTSSSELFGEQVVSNPPANAVDQQNAQVKTEGHVNPSSAPLINELVGEGKRYADIESLVRGKIEADKHIKRIEEENAQYRKEKESIDSNYQAILNKLEENTKNVSAKNDKDALNINSNITEEVDLDTLIESRLSAREKKQMEEANIAKARDLLSKEYGNFDEVKKVVDQFLAEKPYMYGAVQTLLRTNPEALVKEIVNYKAPISIGNSAADPVANVTTVYNKDGTEQYITWADAMKVMKKDLKKYNSGQFQKLIKASEGYYKSKGVNYYAS